MQKPDKYIEKYGTVLSYTRYGNTIGVKGILQPLRYSYKSYLGSMRSPSGRIDIRHYLFITKSDTASLFYKDMKLMGDNKEYRIKSFEPYRVKDAILYVRAVLTACADT